MFGHVYFTGVGPADAGQGARRRFGGTARRIAGGHEEARTGAEATAASGAPGPTAQGAAARGDANARWGARSGSPLTKTRAAISGPSSFSSYPPQRVGELFYFYYRLSPCRQRRLLRAMRIQF